ncbi:MAG: hypothetical protein PHU49_14545 [Syntrophorhabdaceae bacterium]|nr:hypothetical protein [Syntrophorhabdaceae bacterium]
MGKMNNKRVKIYRKEARKAMDKELTPALALFRWMPFKDKIAWKIIKGGGR